MQSQVNFCPPLHDSGIDTWLDSVTNTTTFGPLQRFIDAPRWCGASESVIARTGLGCINHTLFWPIVLVLGSMWRGFDQIKNALRTLKSNFSEFRLTASKGLQFQNPLRTVTSKFFNILFDRFKFYSSFKKKTQSF